MALRNGAQRGSRLRCLCYVRAMPTIVLNGEPRELADASTVAGLLGDLGLDPRQVAVERNQEIVPKAAYDQVDLAEGDRLDVVTFVGGG
jgi:thiamine biosynthesis protein ThiS